LSGFNNSPDSANLDATKLVAVNAAYFGRLPSLSDKADIISGYSAIGATIDQRWCWRQSMG
jgi:hypothetical protein